MWEFPHLRVTRQSYIHFQFNAESGSSYKLRLFALFLRFERTFYNEIRVTAIHGGRTLILWEFLHSGQTLASLRRTHVNLLEYSTFRMHD